MIDTSLARASPSPDPSKNSSGMHVVTACLVAILMVSFVFTAFGENNTTKGLAMWSLTHWNLFFGSAEHIAKFLAIIVGGPWILGVYLAHRQHAWNLQVDISQTFQPINGNLRLLVVKVALENKGKVRVSRSKNEKGLNIAVLRIDQPTTRPFQIHEPIPFRAGEDGNADEFDPASLRNATSSPPRTQNVVKLTEIDAMRNDKRYIIEPNCTFHETEIFVVSLDDLLIITADFYGTYRLKASAVSVVKVP